MAAKIEMLGGDTPLAGGDATVAGEEEEQQQFHQITATEAEMYIEALEPLRLETYSSPKWFRQHEYLEKLNLQSHFNIIHRGDEFVYEALCDLDKIPIVIHELIAAELWKQKVWPLIKDDITDHSSVRAYNALYHECTIAALLEAVLFHKSACEAGDDTLMELVDYCARKLTWLVQQPKREGKVKTTKEMIAEAEDTSKNLENQLAEVNFQCAIIAITMLRYMTDHMESLHVSVIQRLVKHWDFVAMLGPLLDSQPWNKQSTVVIEVDVGEGSTKKKKKKRKTKYERFEDNRWRPCDPGDRKLCKPEAQVWLALFNIIMSAGRAQSGLGYSIDRHRKPQVERLKKYFNEVLTDQLPPLLELRRVVEEVGMMEGGEAEGSSFVIEQVSEMREAMMAERDWPALAKQQLAEYYTMTEKERMGELMRMNDLYAQFDLSDLDDGGKLSDAQLLDKHGACGLAKLYLTGSEDPPIEKDIAKAASYFHLGADQGDPEAQYCYGQRLKKGQGVEANIEEAIKWFKQAADQGHANSMNWLGHVYEKGDGVPVNAAEAVSWNRKSAETGDVWAQTKMGVRFLKGEGVEQNDAEARKWLTLAAEKGSKAAKQKLAELETNELD